MRFIQYAIIANMKKKKKKRMTGVVQGLRISLPGPRFSAWSGNEDFSSKAKKKKKKNEFLTSVREESQVGCVT